MKEDEERGVEPHVVAVCDGKPVAKHDGDISQPLISGDFLKRPDSINAIETNVGSELGVSLFVKSGYSGYDFVPQRERARLSTPPYEILCVIVHGFDWFGDTTV